MKTNELTGAALDWAVAKAAAMTIEIRPAGTCGRPLYVLAAEAGRTPWTWEPSTSWHQGGPIIEREVIVLTHPKYDCWTATGQDPTDLDVPLYQEDGPTPLIAAMRCYVASKLGDDIDVPKELQ
jgi:hypothetical protein